jgi:hypothetical protein
VAAGDGSPLKSLSACRAPGLPSRRPHSPPTRVGMSARYFASAVADDPLRYRTEVEWGLSSTQEAPAARARLNSCGGFARMASPGRMLLPVSIDPLPDYGMARPSLGVEVCSTPHRM